MRNFVKDATAVTSLFMAVARGDDIGALA